MRLAEDSHRLGITVESRRNAALDGSRCSTKPVNCLNLLMISFSKSCWICWTIGTRRCLISSIDRPFFFEFPSDSHPLLSNVALKRKDMEIPGVNKLHWTSLIGIIFPLFPIDRYNNFIELNILNELHWTSFFEMNFSSVRIGYQGTACGTNHDRTLLAQSQRLTPMIVATQGI